MPRGTGRVFTISGSREWTPQGSGFRLNPPQDQRKCPAGRDGTNYYYYYYYIQTTVHVERAVRPCRDGGTLPLAVLSCGPLRRGEDGSHSVAGDEDSEYGHPAAARADTREDMEAVVGQWPGEVCGACWAEWQRPDDDV